MAKAPKVTTVHSSPVGPRVRFCIAAFFGPIWDSLSANLDWIIEL